MNAHDHVAKRARTIPARPLLDRRRDRRRGRLYRPPEVYAFGPWDKRHQPRPADLYVFGSPDGQSVIFSRRGVTTARAPRN